MNLDRLVDYLPALRDAPPVIVLVLLDFAGQLRRPRLALLLVSQGPTVFCWTARR